MRPKCVLRQDPDLRRHRKFFSECTRSESWNLVLWLGRWCDPRNAVKVGMAPMLYMFIPWRQRCFLHIDQRESPLHKNTSLSVSLYPFGLSLPWMFIFSTCDAPRTMQNFSRMTISASRLDGCFYSAVRFLKTRHLLGFSPLRSVRMGTTWRTVIHLQLSMQIHTWKFHQILSISFLRGAWGIENTPTFCWRQC